jgi:sarcosine oxidase subunit alpha
LSERAIEIVVDGRPVPARESWTVAAALWNSGRLRFRTSVSGDARGPLCAMGICFECRVDIDGRPHRRACMEPCVAGMQVKTDG